jgi:histidine ammonia-lyase
MKAGASLMELTGQDLTTGAVARFADGPDEVSISPDALARVAASHREAVRLTGERRVYGRSTGVGANRSVVIAPGDDAAQALLTSHATSAGPVRSPEQIRATLLIRLNQLCAGGAGLRPEIATGLCDLLNAGVLPPVRALSGIGTGDLSALATIGVAVQQHSAGALVFGVHDAMPFLSSNAATLADAALAVERLQGLADASVVLTALTFTAMDGNPEAFSAPVLLATPFAGARETCRLVTGLVGTPSAPAEPRNIQDPFGLRVFPQVHGVFADALEALRGTVTAYLNAPSENPLVLADGSLAHHGGFYAAHLAAATDAARAALASAASLSLTRLTYLSEPLHTRLAPFLGDGTPGASGIMICEYVAAAALARLRAAAMPAAPQAISLSRSVEDDASFASLGAQQLLDGVDDLAVVLAAELVAAARALRQRGIGPAALSDRLGAALTVAGRLPGDDADRDLTGDLAAAQGLLPELAAVLRA